MANMNNLRDSLNKWYVKYVAMPIVAFSVMNTVESCLEKKVKDTPASAYISGKVNAQDNSYKANSSEISESFNLEATKYSIEKNWEKTLELDKKAYDLFPNNPGYNYAVGYALDKLGRCEEAKPYWKKYLDLIKKDLDKRWITKEKYSHQKYIDWAESKIKCTKK